MPQQGAAALGIFAALGAALLWGTMYIPYRKAYISGMNPLSFVTVFTFGELGTVFALAAIFDGGAANVLASLEQAKPVLFWLFLGGFCWVLGDLFQQYAAKYIGISRGIPLSNTNQLWGLAWGALVFGELAHMAGGTQALIIGGSLIMIAGATAISLAEAPADEQREWQAAMERECLRYGLDRERVTAAVDGIRASERRSLSTPMVGDAHSRCRRRSLHLAGIARRKASHQRGYAPGCSAIAAASLLMLAVGAIALWKRTRFG